MLYIVHDFFQNFMSAVKANDTILLTDLITDEVAKLIVFDRGKTIEAIKIAKIKISNKPSDADIIDIFIKEISKNKVFKDAVTDLIILNNSEKSEGDTVPEDKRKEFIEKALVMFINGDNEMLLKKKTASHLKVRDMNFAADAEVINLTKPQKTRIVVKTAFATTAVLTSLFFIGKTLYEKGFFTKNKNNEMVTEEEVIEVTEE